MRLDEYLRSALVGTRKARLRHTAAVRGRPGIPSGVEELGRLCPGDADDPERPIFLLSAGWRSGSTFVQRLLMSDPRVLVWGEPYDECGLIQALAGTVKAFRPGWPPSEYYYRADSPSALTGEWIANLFPDPHEWRRAHRALLDTLLAEPARRRGASVWGVKEVRLGIEHAIYLKWLYPNARFVLLYRNPVDAYRSYARYGRDWYDTWPDRPMFTPSRFGRHWRRLVQGFVDGVQRVDGLLIGYERLVEDAGVVAELEAYLGIVIDRSVIEKRVGSSRREGEQAWVSRFETYLLRRAVDPVARRLGYG